MSDAIALYVTVICQHLGYVREISESNYRNGSSGCGFQCYFQVILVIIDLGTCT